jgi:hypothetical protein
MRSIFLRPSAGNRHTNEVRPAAIALILHSCCWLAGPGIRPGAVGDCGGLSGR